MTIHDFDMARWLLGEEPAAVAAFGAVLTDPAIGTAGDFDSVNVLLETASGKQAVISNSRRATYGYDQRIEVLGSGGMVAAENQREVSIEIATGAGFTRPPLLDFFMTRYTEAYAAEIAAFVAGLSGGAPARAHRRRTASPRWCWPRLRSARWPKGARSSSAKSSADEAPGRR